MESITKNRQSLDTLRAMIGRAFGDDQVPEGDDFAEELGHGWFNVAYAITLADVKQGEWVGVVGGGAVGMLLMQLAHQKGANVLLSEPEEERRKIALRLGAVVVVDPRAEDVVAAALAATGGIGLDRVLEAVGRPATVQQAMQMARRGGTVVVMGVADRTAEIPIRPYDLYERQLTLRGSFIRNFDFQRAVRLLGRLEPVLQRGLGLDGYPVLAAWIDRKDEDFRLDTGSTLRERVDLYLLYAKE